LEERPLLSRLGLHAAELLIPGYTKDGAEAADLCLKAPLPKDMSSLIKQMEKASGKEFLSENYSKN